MRRRAEAGGDRRVVPLREGVPADGDKWREKGSFIPRRAKVQRNRGRPLGDVVDVQKRPVFRRRLGCRHHGADCCQLHGQRHEIPDDFWICRTGLDFGRVSQLLACGDGGGGGPPAVISLPHGARLLYRRLAHRLLRPAPVPAAARVLHGQQHMHVLPTVQAGGCV